jgi:nucleoside-diphosphate-sugar epimerase
MKFAVLGGGGYIGFHIGKDLSSKGYSVVLLDLNKPDEEWGEYTIPFAKVNILEREALEKAFENIDCVIHCVSFGMSGKEQLDWDKTEAINITGTMNVINACAAVGVRGLVYTSTFNVVFGGQEIHNGTEDLPYFPLHRHVDHYSRTKSIAEQLILTSDKKSSLRTCALRLAGVMGLKEKRHLPRIVDSLWMLKFTYGKRDSLVQFVSIENVVQAHVKAAFGLLQKPTEVGGEAFFISDGIPINNFEFFRPLIQGLGYTFPTLNLPLWIMWIFSYLSMAFPWFIPLLTPAEIFKTAVTHYFSNDKAARLLEYQPTNPNDLTSVVQYYKNKQKPSTEQPIFSPLMQALLFAFLFIVIYFYALDTI